MRSLGARVTFLLLWVLISAAGCRGRQRCADDIPAACLSGAACDGGVPCDCRCPEPLRCIYVRGFNDGHLYCGQRCATDADCTAGGRCTSSGASCLTCADIFGVCE